MKKKILSMTCVLISAISFAQIPTDGLVAHYPFNGNANDASTNSNDGTVNGATLTTDRFGNSNSAYSFDGVDDFIEVPHSPSTTFSNEISISFWLSIPDSSLNSSGLRERQAIGKQVSQTVSGLGFEVVDATPPASAGPQFYLQGGASYTQMENLEFNTWNHLVGTYNGEILKLFRGGVLVGLDSGYFDLSTLKESLFFGKEGAKGLFFKGEIDDIRIYNQAITSEEVSSLYNEGVCYKTVQDTNYITVYDTVTTNVTVYDTVTTQINSSIPTSGLVAHYPFNGNANDESGNSNNGIVTGATLTTDRLGNANSAYNFDGIDDYIRIPHDSSLDFSEGGVMSVSFWVYMDSLPEDSKEYQLLMKVTGGGNTTEGYQASIFSNGTYVLRGKNGSGSNWVGNTNTSDLGVNDEYHVVSIIDGQKSKNYINGIFISETTTTNSSIGSNTEDLIFGWNNWLSNATSVAFKGKLDDIRIYNKAITQEEVSSLYNEGACYKTVYDTVTTTNIVTVQDTLSIYLSQLITSVNDASQAETTIKLYPNPTKNEVTVSIDNYTNLSGVSIKVLDALGTVVHQQLITGSTQSIDVSSWTAGVYFLHVINGSKTVDIRKIVVNN